MQCVFKKYYILSYKIIFSILLKKENNNELLIACCVSFFNQKFLHKKETQKIIKRKIHGELLFVYNSYIILKFNNYKKWKKAEMIILNAKRYLNQSK